MRPLTLRIRCGQERERGTSGRSCPSPACGGSVRELQRVLLVSALHQAKLGNGLLSNLLQLCQRLLLPRGLQRYESRVRPRLLQSL